MVDELHTGPGRVPTVRDLIEAAKRKIEVVSCQEAARRLAAADPAPVLVDVREEWEFDLAHIGGSVHVCRGTLEMSIEQDYPDRDTPLLLYCSRGERSALAAATLLELGYRRVSSIDGGLHAWRESGLPVVVPAEQRGPGSGI
ncbi:MAG: sulfurtransferase [Deltaproteobacteria bacterium]|nr:sulfurtransferase [Deltaproteobacteria bacterium]